MNVNEDEYFIGLCRFEDVVFVVSHLFSKINLVVAKMSVNV